MENDYMNKKVKEWYGRHKSLIIKDGWDKEEYDYILDNIINEKVITIDEIIPKLKNKNVNDLVDLLQHELKIGNKKADVILHCAYCGNQIIRNMNEIHKSRVYCNMECRNKYKREYGIHRGAKNPKFNSKIVQCTNCGRDFIAPKYIQNQKNSFGDIHHFCSQKCYWEYRRVYYVGKRASMYNHKFSRSQILMMRERTARMLAEGKFPTKMTKIHKKINLLLDEEKIKYENEKQYKYYTVDIYLPDSNLIIEIMGDYFHANPLKYSKENLDQIQLKNVKKDKSKHTYIKRYYNINILYLWEDDINTNIEKCKNIILMYIESKGNLEKYHSYQYN